MFILNAVQNNKSDIKVLCAKHPRNHIFGYTQSPAVADERLSEPRHTNTLSPLARPISGRKCGVYSKKRGNRRRRQWVAWFLLLQ